MTDNEIIKALKECEECHYYNDCEKSTRLALALINRQKAEIDELNDDVEWWKENSERWKNSAKGWLNNSEGWKKLAEEWKEIAEGREKRVNELEAQIRRDVNK